MDLEALRMFVEVARTGSLFAAAETLDVARPTLRRRIGELEASAGVSLLLRTRRGVKLTEAGTVLATRAQRLLDEAGVLLGAVREVGTEPAGLIRVVAPAGLPPHMAAPLFMAVRMAHPKITTELAFSSDPSGDLLRGADLAFCFGAEPPRGPWISRTIVDAPERLLASRRYLDARGTPRTALDLRAHDLMSWHAPGTNPRVWPAGRGTEIEVSPWLVSADAHFVRMCAAAGLGIAFLPDAALPIADPDGADFVHVLPTVTRNNAVYALVPHALAEAPRIRAALSVLELFVAPSQKKGRKA